MKMNKKGQFFSILIVLVIIAISIFFSYKVQIREREDAFNMDRLQLVVMDNFVREFDTYQLQHILDTAAKPALQAMIEEDIDSFSKISKEDFVKVMKTGDGILDEKFTTDDLYKQVLATLTFNLPSETEHFEYKLVTIKQNTYDTIDLGFEVDYNFTVFGNSWSIENKPVNVSFSVYSLRHPEYEGKKITEEWDEDTDTGTCYIEDIFDDPEPCSKKNIKYEIIVE